jgi:transposase
VEIVYERVAAIDVGKKEIAVTVRVPGQISRTRAQQTRKFRTFYQVLRQMVGWLVDHGVTHVAMEATGVYWKPVVRHEALGNRVGVRGLRRRPVAAGR